MALYPDSGARIRVLRTGENVAQDGKFVSLYRDTLVFEPGDCCVTDTTALSTVAAIDLSRGVSVSPGRVLGGMTWGLFAGMGAGWLVGEIGCRQPDSSELCGIGIGVWMAILGAGGLVTGAIWGMESKVERWERIYPPGRAALFVAPSSDSRVLVGVVIPMGIGS